MRKIVIALGLLSLVACAAAEPTPEQKQKCQSAQPGIVNESCEQ